MVRGSFMNMIHISLKRTLVVASVLAAVTSVLSINAHAQAAATPAPPMVFFHYHLAKSVQAMK